MTLGDLLLELRENVLHDRSSQIDGDSDELWSDTTLVNYLDQAQKRFARKTCCLRDKSSVITRFTTNAYQSEYDLDPSIIAIYSMRFMGNGSWQNGQLVPGTWAIVNGVWTFTPNPALALVQPDVADLGRGGHSQFDQYPTPGAYYFNPRGLSEQLPGKPMAFSTDEEFVTASDGSGGVMTVRLYPISSPQYANCLVQMRVARMPVPLTDADMTAVPQIPEDYHMFLVDYAASRALSIVDHELGDPQRAAEFGQRFEAEIEEVRQEMQRRAFVPMVWGFGRNGFAYEGN